jgi:hypothetical protein
MIETIPITKALPFEIDKVYQTKFATKATFLLKEIVWRPSKKDEEPKIFEFRGLYIGKEHIGICPLGPDRLIPETIIEGTVQVCSKCGTKI